MHRDPRDAGPGLRPDGTSRSFCKGQTIFHYIGRGVTKGADYMFDATGNTEGMRTALEACHRGWGTSIIIIIGVTEAGKTIETRPFQQVTGRDWRGTASGGAKGRTDVPKIADMYMTGKIEIDPMIIHVMRLEEINKAFGPMHAEESIRSVVAFRCRMRDYRGCCRVRRRQQFGIYMRQITLCYATVPLTPTQFFHQP